MSQPFYDLSGLFNIQKDIINNSEIQTNPNIKNINQQISTGLNNIYNTYSQSENTINDTLEHQEKMLAIINSEQNRLNSKQTEIDLAYTGKERALALNESHRLRYKQVLKIILVIIITLIVFIFIIFISKFFPFVPSFVFEILSIIVISIGIIIVYYLTITLLSRSRVYYNELQLPGPGVVGNATVNNDKFFNDKNITDLLNDFNSSMCIGSSCCDVGTVWDTGNGVCMSKTSGFTTINLSQLNGDFYINGTVKPNSPNEFIEYTPI